MFLKGLLYGLGWTTGAILAFVILAGIIILAEWLFVTRKARRSEYGNRGEEEDSVLTSWKQRGKLLFGASRLAKASERPKYDPTTYIQ